VPPCFANRANPPANPDRSIQAGKRSAGELWPASIARACGTNDTAHAMLQTDMPYAVSRPCRAASTPGKHLPHWPGLPSTSSPARPFWHLPFSSMVSTTHRTLVSRPRN